MTLVCFVMYCLVCRKDVDEMKFVDRSASFSSVIFHFNIGGRSPRVIVFVIFISVDLFLAWHYDLELRLSAPVNCFTYT